LKDLREKHGDQLILTKREIKPFERLMLKMGGSEIMRNLAGKKVRAENVTHVYDWIDPKIKLFGPVSQFLFTKTE
jgi:hypothetical protein